MRFKTDSLHALDQSKAFKMERSLAVFFFLSLFTYQVSIAQDAEDADLSTYGHEFYVGFYEHVHTADTHTFYVLTQETTSVTFTVTSRDNAFSYTGITSRDSPATVSIPFSYEIRGETYEWRNKGLRVSSLSKDLISVIAWSYRSAADYMAFLAQPCHEQSTDTYTYYAVSTLGWSDQKSMFLIVACMNDTEILISPSQIVTLPTDAQDPNADLVSVNHGATHNVTLHSMQTLLVYQPYVDLSGTKIVTNKPVTIVSGHEASRVPPGTFDADPIVTQVQPTVTWGTDFLLHPHIGRSNGQNYKIIAHTPTTVSISCIGSTPDTTYFMKPTDVHDFFTDANEYCSLVSTEPLYVAQVGVSTNYNGGNYGDNTLHTLPPVSQYLNTIQYRAFSEAFSYYSVLTTPEYFNTQLVIDGVTLNLTWTPIMYSNGSVAGYGYGSATSGTHIVSHPNSNGKIFVAVYGWTTYGGYSYNAGMGLNPINPDYLPPEVSFHQVLFSCNESDGTITVTLERLKEFETDVTVRVVVSPTPEDSAMDVADYTTFTQIVDFAAADKFKNVIINITNDAVAETTEYFTIALEEVSKEVVIFPYATATVEILDDDNITVGFTSNGFDIDDWDETNVTVAIQSGRMQEGTTVRMAMQVGIVGGENTSSISFDLSNFHYWASFRGLINLFSTYNRNLTQTLWCRLWVEDTNVNTNLDIQEGSITIPPPPPTPTSSSMSSTSVLSTAMTTGGGNTGAMTSTATIAVVTPVMIESTASISTRCTIDTSISVRISTVTSTVSICETRSSGVKATVDAIDSSGSGFNKQISVSSGGLYLGIFIIIITVVIQFVVSLICCYGCYHRGQTTGQKMPIDTHMLPNITVSAQNALYDSVLYDGETASITTADHKGLIESMENDKEMYSEIN